MAKSNDNFPFILFVSLLITTIILLGGFIYNIIVHGYYEPTTHTVDYDIQSIRVDDDSEYHIVAVSKSGNDVETIHDADNGWDIQLSFSDIENPVIQYTLSDDCCGEGNYVEEKKPKVILPFGYKIETFED